jgi:hypothetical protein
MYGCNGAAYVSPRLGALLPFSRKMLRSSFPTPTTKPSV